jgi:hypothetical protein
VRQRDENNRLVIDVESQIYDRSSFQNDALVAKSAARWRENASAQGLIARISPEHS